MTTTSLLAKRLATSGCVLSFRYRKLSGEVRWVAARYEGGKIQGGRITLYDLDREAPRTFTLGRIIGAVGMIRPKADRPATMTAAERQARMDAISAMF